MRLLSIHPLATGLVLSLLATSSTPLLADFRIQNRTNETVHVAVSYSVTTVDPVFGSGSGTTWTEGWFDIAPGQGVNLKKRPNAYYASSDSFKWVGAGTISQYVLPRQPFQKINQSISPNEARSKGYEKRSFESIAGNAQSLDLQYGGTIIHVRNNRPAAMNFKVSYKRPSGEQRDFRDFQMIKSGETRDFNAGADGAGPARQRKINGPEVIMVGVKGADPFANAPITWGFDAAGTQVTGITPFTTKLTSQNGRAVVHINITLK